MKIIKNILAGALLLFSSMLFAQQETILTAYRYQMNVINPAYAGADSQSVMNHGLAQHSLPRVAANQPACALQPVQELQTFIELYLSEQHLFAAQSGSGCPVAALAGEFHRLDDHSQSVAAKVVTALVERLVQLGEGSISKQQAFLCSSAMPEKDGGATQRMKERPQLVGTNGSNGLCFL